MRRGRNWQREPHHCGVALLLACRTVAIWIYCGSHRSDGTVGDKSWIDGFKIAVAPGLLGVTGDHRQPDCTV